MKEDLKNIIKQTVDNHLDDINPEMIWSGIEDKLEAKKRRRTPGFWIFSLLGLAVLVSVLLWQMNHQEIEVENAHVARVHDENSKVSTEVVPNVKNTIADQNVDQSVSANNYSKNDNNIIKNDSPLANFEQKRIVENNKITASETNSNFWANKIKIDNISENVIPEVQKYNLYLNQNIIKTTLSNLEILDSETNNDEWIGSLELYRIDTKNLVAFDIPERVISEVELDEYIYDYPANNLPKTFDFLSSLEIYSGLSYGSKTISDVNQSYAAARNSSEQILEQWNTGIKVDLIKVLDFKIESGLKYSMLTDRWNMQKDESGFVEWTYTKSKTIGGDGSVLDSLVVTDSLMQVSTRTVIQYNSQRLISIPLGVSFGRSINRFNVAIGFGIDINYQLGDRHLIQGENGLPEINRVGGKWVSPSFNGYLQAEYMINEQWAISSRVNFSGLTLKDHESITTLKSNYQLYGLQLGIKKYFGNR